MSQRFGLLPRAPYTNYPVAYHPAAAPCGPGKTYPGGQYSGRGGVFEGSALAETQNVCGYWSGKEPVLPTRSWPDAAAWQNHSTGARMSVMPMSSRPSRVGFAPQRLTLGMGRSDFDSAGQPMVPMGLRVNRSRNVWTGPMAEQDQWPAGWTPRGGILDGSTLSPPGQHTSSAYYDATSPRIVGTNTRIDTLPNPLQSARDVPMANITPNVPQRITATSGFGAMVPRFIKRAYNAMRPTPVSRAQTAMVPQPIRRGAYGASPDARNPGLIGRSMFLGPVYDDGGYPGDVPAQNITPPPMQLMESTDPNSYAYGASPDGLGNFRGFGTLKGMR